MEERPRFRYLTRANGPIPAIADPFSAKLIVDAMGLRKKPVEVRIVELVSLTTIPSRFIDVKSENEDMHSAVYSLLPLIHDAGNCRHRALMLSSLLDAAGVDHELQDGNHPYVHVPLRGGKVSIDYGGDPFGVGKPYASVNYQKGKELSVWLVRWGSIQNASAEKPYVYPLMHDDQVKEALAHPPFKSGFNKVMLSKVLALRKKQLVTRSARGLSSRT